MTERDLTTVVRLHILDAAARTGMVLNAHEVARDLGHPEVEIVEAFRRLGEAHVYVLESGDHTRIRMANPFSAVHTPFAVEVRGRRYFGNCIWDALGVVSLLGGEGQVETHCPDCRTPLALEVAGRRLVRGEGVVHFGVPARQWWDDIVFT